VEHRGRMNREDRAKQFMPFAAFVLKSILLYFDNCDDTIKIKNIEDEI